MKKWDTTCTSTSGIIFLCLFHSFGCIFASSNICTEMNCSRWLPCDFKWSFGRKRLLQIKEFSSYNFLEKSHHCFSSPLIRQLSLQVSSVTRTSPGGEPGYDNYTAAGTQVSSLKDTQDVFAQNVCCRQSCPGWKILWRYPLETVHHQTVTAESTKCWWSLMTSGTAGEVQAAHPGQGSLYLAAAEVKTKRMTAEISASTDTG